jgi:hypothetical protein
VVDGGDKIVAIAVVVVDRYIYDTLQQLFMRKRTVWRILYHDPN